MVPLQDLDFDNLTQGSDRPIYAALYRFPSAESRVLVVIKSTLPRTEIADTKFLPIF